MDYQSREPTRHPRDSWADPSHLTEHVCFLDFSDYHYIVSFNPNTDPHLTTDALRTRRKESWGERLQYITYHALTAVFEAKRPISDIPTLFYSDQHRKQIIAKLTNHETRRFWLHEFPSWSNRLQEEAPIALLNKIGQLNSSKAARSINQVHPTFDLVTAIHKKQIVVVNLAKGYLGDQTALTLGSLFTSIFAQAVYRVQKPVSFYADEFQSYGSHIYTTMLSEYRKFGLKLGLSCQFASQLDETLLDAILSNVRDLVVFNVSSKDAKLLAPQFNSDTQDFNPRVLTTLTKYSAVINGAETPIPPFNPTTVNRLNVVRKASRRRFGRSTSQLSKSSPTSVLWTPLIAPPSTDRYWRGSSLLHDACEFPCRAGLSNRTRRRRSSSVFGSLIFCRWRRPLVTLQQA